MIYRFDAFTLDPDKFELTRDGDPAQVEPQSFLLIRYLLENRQRLVSRDELNETVWEGRAITDWAISAAVKSARLALGDQTEPRRYIATVHGKGFRFVADVETVDSVGAKTGAATAPSTSLIVIPFEMLSADPGDAYFADGFTEDLIAELARIPELAVSSRNASFSLKGGRPDDATLHRDYGVSYAIQGSVRRHGTLMRVNAQLRDLRSDRQIWADRFDGEGEAVFAVQDKVIDRLVLSLKLELANPRPPRRQPDPRAYDLCLRGRHEYFQYTPKHIASALRYFEQAAEIDPHYAEVLAYQSYCRTSMYVFAMPNADDGLGSALELAEQAVLLDPASAIAHARLGWVLGFLGLEAKTLQSFDRAMALDPRNAEVLHSYGETLNRLGQPRKGLELLHRAMRMEAFAPPSWDWARGHSFILMRQYDEALGHILPVLERVPTLVPALVQLARLYVEAGQMEDARRVVQDLGKAAPRYRILNAARMFPYPREEERNRLVTALKAAGLAT